MMQLSIWTSIISNEGGNEIWDTRVPLETSGLSRDVLLHSWRPAWCYPKAQTYYSIRFTLAQSNCRSKRDKRFESIPDSVDRSGAAAATAFGLVAVICLGLRSSTAQISFALWKSWCVTPSRRQNL